MTLATLPMYDFEELREATDALWAAIAARLRAQGIDAPATLQRSGDLNALWANPGLLLGQTCGYPLMTSLRGKVRLVATPCYRAEGCEGAFYRSAVIVRAGDPARTLADLRGRRCAVNDPASNSGMNLLRAAVAPLAAGGRFFAAIEMTGAHLASAAAVAEGRADVAAIDCVTWAHMQRLRPADAQGLRVLAWTQASPGLPLVTAVGAGEVVLLTLRRALREVASETSLAAFRAALLLKGFAELRLSDYDDVLAVEARARAAGYAELA